MSRLLRFIGSLTIACSLLSSCVSTKKYNELDLVRQQYKEQYEELLPLVEEKQSLQQELVQARTARDQSQRRIQQLEAQMINLESSNADLKRRYDQLLEQNKIVIDAATTEKQDLRTQLTLTEEQLDEKERKLNASKYLLDEKEATLAALQADLDQREQRVKELEAALQTKENQMTSLKASINNALRGFSTNDLTVTEQNGDLYVSLNQGLLFSKGGSQLDFKGKNALKSIAEALKSNPEFDILVEGHTDNDGSAARNWQLSTERAVAVVQELVADGVAAERLTAAGRSFFDPVAPNDTPDNKAKNRRTEIIISPKLDVLYNVINQK